MVEKLLNMLDELEAGIEQATAPEQQTAVDSDGWVFVVGSGEVVGRLDVTETFRVDSVDAAEWVLEIRSQVEGEIAGIDARIQALTENLKALRAAKVRRLSWWDWKFGASLIAFARSQLKGKERTARFAWGKVAFRRTQGTRQILDMAEAVQWMRIYAPERVKVVTTETVKVSDVLLTVADNAQKYSTLREHLGWLKESGSEESVTITTGIEITGEKT